MLAAVAALATAIFTYRSAEAARDAANATQRAAKATAIYLLRSQQPQVSDANRELSNLVREKEQDWLLAFGDSKTMQYAYATHRQANRNLFQLAHLYAKHGVLDGQDVKGIISRTSAQIFIDVVEPMERVIRSDYGQEPFAFVARLYGLTRFSGCVYLIGEQPILVSYPPGWQAVPPNAIS